MQSPIELTSRFHPASSRSPQAGRKLPRHRRSEAGYILLIFLVLLAMMVVGMMAAAPRLAQQIKRDRETEMIHRGEQYARAIKKYYKKFGRYPGRIEDLEKTSTIRFLRKRYTDPTNGNGPFRLVRFGEIQLSGTGPGISAQQVATASQAAGTGSLFNLNVGGSPGSSTSATAAAGAAGMLAGTMSGATQQPAGTAATGTTGTGTAGASTDTTGSASGTTASSSGTTGSSSSGSSLFSNPASTAQPGGGAAIMGVASLSKDKGIHEFNKKTDIKDWLFIYDPAQDRGQLLKGPYNPQAYFGQFNSSQGTIGKPIGQPIGQPAGGTAQPGAGTPMGTPSPGINPASPGAPNPPAPQ